MSRHLKIKCNLPSPPPPPPFNASVYSMQQNTFGQTLQILFRVSQKPCPGVRIFCRITVPGAKQYLLPGNVLKDLASLPIINVEISEFYRNETFTVDVGVALQLVFGHTLQLAIPDHFQTGETGAKSNRGEM